MKKEKYIRRCESSYQVRIKYNQDDIRKEYSKTFKFTDYKSESDCLKHACAHRDEMLYKLQFTDLPSNPSKTLAEVYEESKSLFPMTKETERKHDLLFRSVLEQYGDKPIKDINAKQITMSLNEMTDKSQDNINRRLAIWKTIYRVALISNYVMVDETIRVVVPKSERIIKKRDTVMRCSLDEVLKALDDYGTSIPTKYNCKMVKYSLILMSAFGLRPAECYALTADDFDLKNRTLDVYKAIGSTHDNLVTVKVSKNSSSVRTMPIPNYLIPTIEELFQLRKGKRLFAFYDESLMDSKHTSALIHLACEKAGIQFNSYMLRHQFSTKLISAGVDIRTAMELMGHSESSMTVFYANSTEESKREAMDNIEK